MGIKYTIPTVDDFNTPWRAEIDIPNFDGEPTILRGVGRRSIIASWNVKDSDEPYSAIVSSRVTLSFYNTEEAAVDVEELQLLKDLQSRVNVYRDNTLWWTGYVVPDGIQRYFKARPYPVQITAVDGLSMLADIPFTGSNNWPMQDGVSNRAPLAFIREVLYKTQHLNIHLPIRWASSVECTYFPGEDAIAGSVVWGNRGEPFRDFNGNPRSCMYVIEGMVKAFQCRIFQYGGRWHIMRINEVVEGLYDWKEINAVYGVTSPPAETNGTDDLNAEYRIVNNNHVIMIKPALTETFVRYDHAIAENIIPNGGFEMWSLASILLYWGYTTNPDNRATRLRTPGLSARGGYAVDLIYPFSETYQPDAIFELIGDSITDTGLPIDANILFKRFTFGFMVCPKFGFPYDTETGIIDWSGKPLRIRVSYVTGDGMGDSSQYYLNEFGNWQYYPEGGYMWIPEYSSVNDGSDRIFRYTFEGTPLKGDTIELKWHSDGPPESRPSASMTVEGTAGSLFNTLQDLQEEIPSIWASQIVNLGGGRYRLDVTSPGQSFINDGYFVGSGANTLDPSRTIGLEVIGAKMNDIISFQFQGKGQSREILFPDPGILDGTQDETVGKFAIEFFLKNGQQYTLDEVWVHVDDNNDVYRSYLPGNSSTNKQEETLQISSSFNGSVVSNFMTVFTKSNEQFIFTDGTYTGSLTGMTANAMMRFRNKASRIFEGDIYTDGDEWMFHHIYSFNGLDGSKFLPLASSYNIETGVVSLTAIEGRDDTDVVLLEDHYGSNDKQLSTGNL